MPAIEHVNINDVYPWEDEYGNEFLSRDYSTKENQRYVERLAESMRAKGVPDEPVQLSRDGGIYRIVSGNSRVRAMRLLGTKTFDAIVLDDAEAEQAMRRAVETTVRTNTKKKYDPLEESRFVQQLAMFQSDEYVAEAAGIAPEQVRRIRKGRRVVGDDAEEMTLYRLAAIAEFEGDEAAVEQLSRCPEREIDANLGLLRSKRERSEKEGTLAGALEAAGIPVVEEVTGMRVVAIVGKPESIAQIDAPEGAVAAPHSIPGFFAIYAPADPGTAEEDMRAEQEVAERKARAERYQRGARRRVEWVRRAIEGGNPLARLQPLVLLRANRFTDSAARRFVEESGIDGSAIPVGASEVVSVFMDMNASDYGIHAYDGSKPERLCRRYTVLMEALACEGYEPDVDERELYEEAQEVLGEEQQ